MVEDKRILNRSLKHLIPLEIGSKHAKWCANATANKVKAPAQKQQKELQRGAQQPQRHSKRSRRNAEIIGELY